MKKKDLHFDTICLHGGFSAEKHLAHLTPIYATSTFLFNDTQHAADLFSNQKEGYIYGRFGNPTITACEEKLAMLETHKLLNEDGSPLQAKAILHASGMAAFTTLFLSQLKHGQKILSHFSLYGGTQEMFDKILPLCGVENILVDLSDINAIEKLLQEDSSIHMIHVETPANPTMSCTDLSAVCAIAKKYNKLVSVDNTFATPYLQQPFAFGADFIVHSTTKFLNGHGTAIGGVLIGKDLEQMNTKITKHFRLLGGNSNGFDAFLLTNGIKTLGLRMDRHCSNAEKVALFLNTHPKIEFVNYLGLESHKDYAICKKQMRNAGAMLSFEIKGGMAAGKKFLESIQLGSHAVSLGTADTLYTHAASTTHLGVTKEVREKGGITDGLIRMSVGMEFIDDLIQDIDYALSLC
jgi:methionine-gamma-lyase